MKKGVASVSVSGKRKKRAHAKLEMTEKVSVAKEEEEPQAKKAKKVTTDEIDDIFASSKKKKEETAKKAEEEKGAPRSAKAPKKAKKDAGATAQSRPLHAKKAPEATSNLDDLLDPKATKKGRKYVDGLPVYTYEELGISANSGGTPLCPFDCDCCH